MPSYFDRFPTVKYNGREVLNITRRAKLKESFRQNPFLYLPYVVEDDDRPEDVAFYYYGDPGYVWLIYYANDIVDPYTDWPMSYDQLNRYLIKKYQPLAPEGTVGFGVIHWMQNTGITENIKHHICEDGTILSPETPALLPSVYPAESYTTVRFYDWELEQNELKRNIFMVNREFADQMEKELEKLLNE